MNRILKSIQSPLVESNQFQLPTDLIDSQILIDIITNRHPTILLIAEQILGNITTTLHTSCPQCKDINIKLDQIIMLWGLIWYSVNNMNGGGGWISLAAYRACYPAACTNDDILANSYTFGALHSLSSKEGSTFLFSFLNSEEAIEEIGFDMFMGCTTDERYNGDWNVGNKIILAIFSILLVFLVGGTLFDIHERITRQKENNATTSSIIRGFSLLKNFEFIFS